MSKLNLEGHTIGISDAMADHPESVAGAASANNNGIGAHAEQLRILANNIAQADRLNQLSTLESLLNIISKDDDKSTNCRNAPLDKDKEAERLDADLDPIGVCNDYGASRNSKQPVIADMGLQGLLMHGCLAPPTRFIRAKELKHPLHNRTIAEVLYRRTEERPLDRATQQYIAATRGHERNFLLPPSNVMQDEELDWMFDVPPTTPPDDAQLSRTPRSAVFHQLDWARQAIADLVSADQPLDD